MAAFPEMLEENVAPKAESRRSDGTPGMAGAQLRDHMCQVARFAGMIEARDTVGLAAAAAEVHPHTPKAPAEEMMKHPGHVAPPRRSLESVQQHDDGRARRGFGRVGTDPPRGGGDMPMTDTSAGTEGLVRSEPASAATGPEQAPAAIPWADRR